MILLCTAKICDQSVRRFRIVLGALTGSGYAVLSVLDKFAFFTHPLMKIAAGAVLVLIVFGSQERLLRTGLVFLAVSAGFGGMVMALSFFGGRNLADSGAYSPLSARVLLLSFAVIYGILSLVFRRMARHRGAGGIIPLSITLGGNMVHMMALRDTGNSLSDPLTGRRVIVCETAAAEKLFDRETRQILQRGRKQDPIQTLEALADRPYRFQLVPFTAVGTQRGMLLAFVPEQVTMNGKITDALIALSPHCVSDGGAYSALAGGE